MSIEIRDAGSRGRGVFAVKSFAPDERIETCPVLVLPDRELPLIDQTVLYAYYFGWPDGGAIATGFGSFYNHAETPNARYEKDTARRTLTFIAKAPIAAGEEITIRYNPGPDAKLWFDPT